MAEVQRRGRPLPPPPARVPPGPPPLRMGPRTCPLLLRVFTKALVLSSVVIGSFKARISPEAHKSCGWCFASLKLCFGVGNALRRGHSLPIGGHHSDNDFAVRGKEPKDEVQIYTWMDAALRELTDLVKEVAPEARRRDASLSFAFVYPDKRGRFVVREV
ncbi:histone deacetylase complex subunit sap18, partial [Nicotiana attenuata]